MCHRCILEAGGLDCQLPGNQVERPGVPRSARNWEFGIRNSELTARRGDDAIRAVVPASGRDGTAVVLSLPEPFGPIKHNMTLNSCGRDGRTTKSSSCGAGVSPAHCRVGTLMSLEASGGPACHGYCRRAQARAQCLDRPCRIRAQEIPNSEFRIPNFPLRPVSAPNRGQHAANNLTAPTRR